MNDPRPELADNFTPRNRQQHNPNHLPLIIFSLLITLGTGSWLWREIQLNAAQQLIENCIESHQICPDHLSALEKLFQARRSLRLFNLPNTHLEKANLSNANLQSSNLENAHLENAHLENAHLEKANLSIAHLENAHLEKAHLENTNLSHTHLENAYLQGAELQGAQLYHEHLQGAHLNRANLQGVQLYHADFERANFHRANLSQTYLYKANFHRAILYGANLQAAHLIEAQNLTPAQIKSACYWSQAIYKGLWSPAPSKWIVDEKANQQFIQQLQQDQDSDPKTPVDCSEWSEPGVQ